MRIGLRELTFFLVLLGILGGAVWFVFVPSWRRIENIRQDCQTKTNRLAQLGGLGQTSESIGKEVAELTAAVQFFESKLPNDQQIHTVLREVTQITDKHGLATKSVRTLKQVESAEYIAQPIEIDLSGAFDAFYRFLLDLERLPRICRIGQMELTKDKAGEGLIQAKMIVSVYFESGSRSSGGPASRSAIDGSTGPLCLVMSGDRP